MKPCKWCGASVVVGAGPPTAPEWVRWRCNCCGAFGYVNDPSASELSEIYRTAWQDSEHHGDFAAGSTTEKIANSLLDVVKWRPSNGNCLDYGGGKGDFAKALLKRGCLKRTVYEPFGTPPGLPTVHWINDLKEQGTDLFEWIFMVEVLEHLLNPQEELEVLRRHLAPNGRLVITTPNAKGLRARIDGFSWREIQNPTHINLFTEQTLKACLLNAGFFSARRIYSPVSYKPRGIQAAALALTQFLGVDGGMRFIAQCGK